MKAARFSRFGGPEVLEVVELPDPHPGPGQVRIAVRAAGFNASDAKKRAGLMDQHLPQTLGYEAAGVVDELGAGVTDAAVGDAVFGFCQDGAAQAESAVLTQYAPLPPGLGFAEAAALPAAVETAARALDRLGVTAASAPSAAHGAASAAPATGRTLLVSGASGSVGSAAVQLAVARGARVIGTASPANHDHLRALGAEPVAHGPGLADRVRALAPDGVALALDVAGHDALPDLIALTGDPDRVVTLADVAGAQRHGVHFSRGDDGRALYILSQLGELTDSGRYTPPPVRTFPLAAVADAHRAAESATTRAKIVLLP